MATHTQTAAEAVHDASVNGVTIPINPFPMTSYSAIPSSIPFNSIFTVLFLIVVVVWIVYSLIACYHWLRYGHRSALAIPALVLHFFVSGFCLIFALSGL